MVSYLICFQNQKALSYFQGFFFLLLLLSRDFCRLPADTVYWWPAEQVLSSYWTAEFVQYGRDELRKCLEVLCHCCRQRVLDFIRFFALQLQRTFFHHFSFYWNKTKVKGSEASYLFVRLAATFRIRPIDCEDIVCSL